MKDNLNILKKSIRQRRSISSCLGENGSYNYSEEEKNKSKNSIKSFHRKTTSSYFCGSYLSSNLEDDLLNNINIDKIYLEKNIRQETKNMNNSIINKDNNFETFLNLSFHSYDSDKTDGENIIFKKNNNKTDIKNKDIETDCKIQNNFVSFKNNLKNIKDKDERATKSYLLALGMTKNENLKEQYIPTVSIIEEEKSEVIDSKSELSNKKKNMKHKYCFGNYSLIKDNLFLLRRSNKLKFKNIFGKKNISNEKKVLKQENKDNILEQKEKNKNEKSEIKLTLAFNEIIKKNNKKEENKRKNLKKNKILLLNSFLGYGTKNLEQNNGNIEDEKRKSKNGLKITENNDKVLIEKSKRRMEKKFLLFINEKIRNSYYSNFIKKRFKTENNINNDKGIKSKILQNSEKTKYNQTFKKDKMSEPIKCKNFEDTINLNTNINKNNSTNSFIKKENEVDLKHRQKSNIPIITKIEYRPRSKIPYFRQKIIEKKEININTNLNTNNTNNNDSIINKNSAPNRKYISKYKNIPHKSTYSFNKDKKINNKENSENSHSVKQIKSKNEAIEIIRIEKIKSKKRNNYILHNNSSSFIKPMNINTKSYRHKEKENKIYIRKANSGTFRNDFSLKLMEEKSHIKLSVNKNSTVNTLKLYLKFEKKYTKDSVLKQIEKTLNAENSFFIIICERITIVKNTIQSSSIFVFKSLMKYYKKHNRFIKIYGDENEANSISIKNININKYEIYQVNYKNELNEESFYVTRINELKFISNAVILCKK